ncbi:DUF4340 domain-containing protein [Clostridium estertheticum]|uniref:DUF4340 domain-containing protein n=1 Tax=Clostridium estertheticum TaxID=238834 RepID=UPI0013E92E47|nr:DUF4340 domain-containing protein [Clostridium estertheticum]MBZ9685962.1 DUF4340 domain-containing protein [Clostridium estertheticum]
MKKLKSIIALIVILILLGGVYFYKTSHPAKSNKNASTSNASTSSVQVWKIDSTKVSKVILTSGKVKNTLVKSGNNWTIPNYNYKLDQNAINSITDNVINLSASSIVENDPKDLEKYGLNNTTISANVLGDGSQKDLYIGDKTSDGNSYYAIVKDDNKIYLIAASTVDYFGVKQADLRDKTITAIDGQTLSYIKIVQAGSPTIELTPNSGQNQTEAKNGINAFKMIQPYSVEAGADDQRLQSLASAIPNLKAREIVDDNPKDLSIYGLNNPTLDITLKDSKNNLHFIVGKNKDDNNVYFKTMDSNTIYTMDKIQTDAFKLKAFDIVIKLAYIVNINDVDKITVDANGSNNIINFFRNTKKSEKSGDPDTVVTKYKVNDKSIEEEKFKSFYQEMIGLSVDSENDKKLEDKPEVSITFNLNKGSKKQEKIDYVPYNDQFYAVFRSGKSDFVISKDKVNKMITDLKKLK